ncbi:MAG: hypothetical protein U9N41_09535 [Euryarchaeota archaeon]|nr:hypothetical protein [Euryarchaeota archaeon]
MNVIYNHNHVYYFNIQLFAVFPGNFFLTFKTKKEEFYPGKVSERNKEKRDGMFLEGFNPALSHLPHYNHQYE